MLNIDTLVQDFGNSMCVGSGDTTVLHETIHMSSFCCDSF